MITDEILEAIDLFTGLCCNGEETAKMEALREMLKDFSEAEWLSMSENEKAEWVGHYFT